MSSTLTAMLTCPVSRADLDRLTIAAKESGMSRSALIRALIFTGLDLELHRHPSPNPAAIDAARATVTAQAAAKASGDRDPADPAPVTVGQLLALSNAAKRRKDFTVAKALRLRAQRLAAPDLVPGRPKPAPDMRRYDRDLLGAILDLAQRCQPGPASSLLYGPGLRPVGRERGMHLMVRDWEVAKLHSELPETAPPLHVIVRQWLAAGLLTPTADGRMTSQTTLGGRATRCYRIAANKARLVVTEHRAPDFSTLPDSAPFSPPPPCAR